MSASILRHDPETGTFVFLDPWGHDSLPYMSEVAAMRAVIRDLRCVVTRLPNGQRSPAMSMGDGFERFGSFKSEKQSGYFWDLVRTAFKVPAPEVVTPIDPPTPVLTVPRLRMLADTAIRNGVKKIHIQVAPNMRIKLGKDGRLHVVNPDVTVIKKNKATGEQFETALTLAMIDGAGLVDFVDKYHAESSAAALALFNDDPAKAAALHGHATGACCFCGRHLNDPSSVQEGYGPICAKKYGLPRSHGDNDRNVARAVAGVV